LPSFISVGSLPDSNEKSCDPREVDDIPPPEFPSNIPPDLGNSEEDQLDELVNVVDVAAMMN
jgi:hypothetical protein